MPTSRRKKRTSPLETFGYLFFLLVVFPLVMLGLLLATGTALSVASALIELYYILLLVAALVYVFGWLDKKFRL